MIEPGLKRAAKISFVLHMAFISLMFISIGRRPSFVMPPPYVVSLVSPSQSDVKASRIPPTKKDVPAVKEKVAPEPKGVRAVEKAPPKPTEDLTKYSEEKIAALRAKMEREQYLEDRKSAIEAKQKLARVKQLGEAKSAVSVTARPVPGAIGPDVGDASLVGDYISMVASLIQQEWVLFEKTGKDRHSIIAVRILKGGGLKITKVEQSSGDAIFDNSAVKSIKKASPVPPPPYEMEIGVRFIPAYE